MLFSCVWLFVTPWTAACQPSLSSTIFAQTHIHWVSDAIHLFHLSSLLLLPIFLNINVFSNESALCIRWENIGASASTMSEYTGLFLWDWLVWSSCRPRDSQVFFSTTVLKHHFFGAQPSLMSKSLICTWLLKNHSFDYADLGQQSDVSAF